MINTELPIPRVTCSSALGLFSTVYFTTWLSDMLLNAKNAL